MRCLSQTVCRLRFWVKLVCCMTEQTCDRPEKGLLQICKLRTGAYVDLCKDPCPFALFLLLLPLFNQSCDLFTQGSDFLSGSL